MAATTILRRYSSGIDTPGRDRRRYILIAASRIVIIRRDDGTRRCRSSPLPPPGVLAHGGNATRRSPNGIKTEGGASRLNGGKHQFALTLARRVEIGNRIVRLVRNSHRPPSPSPSLASFIPPRPRFQRVIFASRENVERARRILNAERRKSLGVLYPRFFRGCGTARDARSVNSKLRLGRHWNAQLCNWRLIDAIARHQVEYAT